MIIDEDFVRETFRRHFENCFRVDSNIIPPRPWKYLSEEEYQQAYNLWYNNVYLPSIG